MLPFIFIGLFDEENVPWLLGVLKEDILEVKDNKVTKEAFIRVRGEGEGNNAFWKAVSSTAVEKFNMKEVFNMNSTVRLTAIEKLGTVLYLVANSLQVVPTATTVWFPDPGGNWHSVSFVYRQLRFKVVGCSALFVQIFRHVYASYHLGSTAVLVKPITRPHEQALGQLRACTY